MTMASFKVEGRLDGSDGGKIMIDRATGLIAVRPKHCRRVYELRLIDVAEMIVHRVVLAEQKQALK